MKKSMLLALAAIVLVVGTVDAAPDSSLWLHVRVDEDEGTKVKINLPINMVPKMISIGPVSDHFENGKIRLDDKEISVAELREIWLDIKDSPDMTFVTVEDVDETVKVWKEAGDLRVEVRGSDDETVDVRVHVSVVDALLSGQEDELDISAAVAALAEVGAGELVTVSQTDQTVRVWIDSSAEPE